MSAMTVMPRDSRDWTVADLEQLPDDGLQYELLDGMLLVTPAPIVRHQAVSAELFALLRSACPQGLHVFFAPVDWQPDNRTSLQPDLLVIRHLDLDAKKVSEPLPLAVEVLSPSTRRKDLLLKRSKYQDAGVESYWVVDPVAPSILALDLVGGEYVTAGEAVGDQALTLDRPFPITVIPAALTRA